MMLNDQKYREIVNEWFANLEKGYAQPPYTEYELNVLNEVVQQHNLKLTEAAFDFMSDAQTFEQYITKNYVASGQAVNGIQLLFNSISNKPDVISLIDKSYSRSLKSQTYTMTAAEKKLYSEIMNSIRIPNGEPSELWFAIVYNGQVKGGVTGRTIVSDIEVGADDVSLKNYKDIKQVDFGTISGDAWESLQDMFSILKLITGQTITQSLTRSSLNSQFAFLAKPEIQKQISDLVELSKTTNIDAIKNIAARFNSILEGKPITELLRSILDNINNVIKDKVTQVTYWGIILNDKVYLESSDNIYNKLKTNPEDIQLPDSIAQFKGSKLYVNGNKIHSEIIS